MRKLRAQQAENHRERQYHGTRHHEENDFSWRFPQPVQPLETSLDPVGIKEELIISRILRGETDVAILHRSDYRSVEEMAGQLHNLLKSLPADNNYTLKIQVVNPCER